MSSSSAAMLDGSGGKTRAGGVAMTTISECVSELQAALNTIESGGSLGGSQHGDSPHDKFSATKSLFYCLVRLNVLIAHSNKETLLPLEGLCVSVISTMLQARKLTLSAAFRQPICDFYATMLVKSTTVNLYTVIKDMQSLLMASKTVPLLSRVAALEVLARVFRLRARQLSPTMIADCLVVIAKQLKSSELVLRETALVAIAAGGVAGKAEIFKALRTSFADKNPEVRGGLALCLMGLIRSADDFSSVSIDSLLTLGLKGLEDGAGGGGVQVQLLFAEAMAHFLALSVAGQALESKAKIIKSARGETEDAEAAKADAAGSSSSSSGVEKAMAKLKDIGGGPKRSAASSSTSFTLESAVQYLISLFLKAAAGAPFSQGGIAAVLVAFLRRQKDNIREDTMQWLLSVLLSTVTRVGSQPNSREEVVTRTSISHILRAGLAAGSPELLQLSLARALVKLISPDSNLNSHQLQLVLAELSNLIRALEEASSCLTESTLPRLLELLRHLSYGVRFEAAVCMESLCHALPHLSSSLLQQLVVAIRLQYEALAALTANYNGPPGGNGGGGGDGDGEDDDSSNKASDGGRPLSVAEVKRAKSAEAERRYRICALHGNSNALVMLLKGLKSLDVGVPPRLLEDAMAVAKQLVNQQFSPQMRKWATCVRAGWSILSAILYQGSDWAVKYIRILFQLFGRSMELEANRQGSEAAEPSNLLESMLGTVLVFVRECPQVLWTTPGALTATVELLDKNLEICHARFFNNNRRPLAPSAVAGQLRLWLVKAMLMEAYSWLPPGSYPASCDVLFRWSVTTVCELIAAGAVPGEGGSAASGGAQAGSGATAPADSALDNSLLPYLVNKDDDLLDCKSSYRGSVGQNLEVDVTSDLLAMQVHLAGLPLEDREKDASIATGAVGSSKHAALSWHHAQHDSPPTPLHANYWVRPPMPHPSARVRLLDAAICLLGATFGHQSNDWQTQAVEKLVSLLPSSLLKADDKGGSGAQGGMGAVISVLTSEEERKRKDERQAQVCRNVSTVLLAMLQGLPAHTDSRLNVEVAWVARMREALHALLGCPQSLTRRAACESLALLAQKMGGGSSIDTMVQGLVELSLRKDPVPSSMAASTASMLKGVAASSSVASALPSASYRSAGATFALACLRRTLGTQVRLSSCWTAVQRIMVADVPQPLRTWGLHSLLLLLRSMSIGQNFGVVTHDTLQTLDTIMEILEAHFLGVWSSPPSAGSEHVPGLLMSLVRLMNALLPMIMDLQPDSPSIDKFKAMWGVMRLHDDSRVELECLQFVEILALFSPKDVAQGPALDFLRSVLSRPHKSRACVSTALSCLRCLAKREGNRTFRRQHLEVLLLSVYEEVCSCLHWDQVPLWRFIAVPRDVDRWYYGFDSLLDEIRASLDVVVATDSKRSLHYILLARAVILGASHARVEQQQPVLSSLAPRRSNSMDEDGSLDGPMEAEGAAVAREPLADRLRRQGAELLASLPASRWQVKVVAIELILQALRLVMEGHGPPDLVKARQAASRPATALAEGESALLVGLFLEDLVAVACSTAAAVVDDQPLPTLQENGVLLLKALLLLFGSVPDPDSPPGPDGHAPPVLQQFTSQITSALTPALTCPFSPGLVSTASDLVLTALTTRLVDDPVVARRLLNQILPAGGLDPQAVTLSSHEGLPLSTALRMRNVRLRAAADVYVLTARGSLAAETSEALGKVFGKHLEGLEAHWLAAVKDAVRLQQDKDLWPALGDRAVRLGGCTYDEACDPAQLLACYAEAWPVMAAALALLANQDDDGWGERRKSTCQLLLAVVDTAIQSAADSGCMTSQAIAARQAAAAPSAAASFLSPPDEHRGMSHAITALDALLRPPFLREPDCISTPQVVRLLRALAHGPCLRPDSHPELHLLTAQVLGRLLSAEKGLLKQLVEREMEAAEMEAGTGGATASGEEDAEQDEEEGEGSLWLALLEVVFVPLCRILPHLFANNEDDDDNDDDDQHNGSNNGRDGATPEPPGSSQYYSDRRQESKQLGREAALQSPLFLECLRAVQHLPALCPAGVEGAAFPTFISVAVRTMRLAASPSCGDDSGAALIVASWALLSACTSPCATHALVDAALALLPALLSLRSPPRLRALLDAWLSLLAYLAPSEEATVQRCLATLSRGLPALELPCRLVVLSAVRACIQCQPSLLGHALLRLFGPPALLALYTPLSNEEASSSSSSGGVAEHYYAEAVKLLLQAFTGLGPTDQPDQLARRQGQHLALMIPALMHFLSHTAALSSSLLDQQSVLLLTTLVSQALLSIARTAPQPFKEQVQLLDAATRQALETTLRAQSNPAARGGSSAPKPLKIDLARFEQSA